MKQFTGKKTGKPLSSSNQFASSIAGQIHADEISLGQGVVIEDDVVITGKDGPAKSVIIGDFAFIGRGTRIFVPEFRLGDYSKLHASSFCHGPKPLQIGRNCWIGGNTVLDSLGGLDIDDNVGIGAQSQIWTHIQFGDIVEGCRFHSKKYMHIGRDAWFVGHCIVSPVSVGERAMALVGSVVTRDMLPNHVYAGMPAKDITDKAGHQFEERTIVQKEQKLSELITKFELKNPEHAGQIKIVRSTSERMEQDCWFDIATRTYNQKYRSAEVQFLKMFVPLIKFTPDGKDSFIDLKLSDQYLDEN